VSSTAWWDELTAAGGEGMVVKPAPNLTRGRRGVMQPGLKVRGREYLRLIYSPDYTEPKHLERLRERSLGRKRGLALREYALGLEGLERLTAANRSGGSTSASSPCWRSSLSRSTPGFEPAARVPASEQRLRKPMQELLRPAAMPRSVL
jgi:PNKP adenylyltransferase domain, ligase domain/PNKP adenylyltransferase domain, C-terminal region